MLVVVFDSKLKTYEGTQALSQLDKEGNIAIHAESVIKKNANGEVELMKTESNFPIRTIRGTAIGSLIGLLGGPVGLFVGAATGTIVGYSRDLYMSGVNADFINEVSAKLTSDKFAVVADISEESVTPLDIRMETLGGSVFRTAKSDFEIEQRTRDVQTLEEDIEQLETEMAETQGEPKAKLQAKIDILGKKLQKKREQAEQRLEQIKIEHEAKVRDLKKKAAKTRGDKKSAMVTRMTQIRDRYQQSKAKLENLTAERHEKRAQQLKKKRE